MFDQLVSNLVSQDKLVQIRSAKILLFARDRPQYFAENSLEIQRPILDDSQNSIVEELADTNEGLNSIWEYFDEEELFEYEAPCQVYLDSVTDLSNLSIKEFEHFNLEGWSIELKISNVELTTQVLDLLDNYDWRYRVEALDYVGLEKLLARKSCRPCN